MIFEALAATTVAIWLYLVLGHGRFWLCKPRDSDEAQSAGPWPRVTVVVPARDEAAVVGDSVRSLLQQDYLGDWAIVLVDDNSTDGTADVARGAARGIHGAERLQVIDGKPLSAGWTGKLWALEQGIEAARNSAEPPKYLLLTDADIVYTPKVLSALVARAEAGQLGLASLMVKLRCSSPAERSLIPAFIFFFQMLYPFAWVNRPDRATAAAAGGCMLVRTDRLQEAGGIVAIRDALIDDCALARRLKAHGPIWLGLTERVHSIREYPHFGDIRSMVARSAFAQLRFSPLLLAATVLGMALVYLAPPLLTLFTAGPARWMGLAAWILMAIAFQPTLRLYRLSPLWGLALPVIALAYVVFTIDSALQFTLGKGGFWKGRVQATGP